MDQTLYTPLNVLIDRLEWIRRSPKDDGVLRAIVIRPVSDERISLEQCDLSPEGGVHGDSWANGCWLTLDDGRPDPEVQVTLINTRLLDSVGRQESRWRLAGDQLCVDLDLSIDNLPVGQQLAIGSVVLQVTAQPHTGCRKFSERYGPDALRFVSSPDGQTHRLRGMYARVVQSGRVAVGETIKKI